MDHFIEKIYNTYLRVSRTQANKPFRYRKNFENFESDPNYLPALKLKSFFSRHPQIKMEDFFVSPYIVFKNDSDSFYDLKFYNSFQALKVYSLFNKQQLMDDPDSELQLGKIKDGLAFIKNFCIEERILLKDYLTHRPEKTHSFLIHLVHKNITIYNLFPFKNFDSSIREYDFELLSFILGDLAARISHFRSKYYASKQAKLFCIMGLKKIEKIIENHLDI